MNLRSAVCGPCCMSILSWTCTCLSLFLYRGQTTRWSTKWSHVARRSNCHSLFTSILKGLSAGGVLVSEMDDPCALLRECLNSRLECPQFVPQHPQNNHNARDSQAFLPSPPHDHQGYEKQILHPNEFPRLDYHPAESEKTDCQNQTFLQSPPKAQPQGEQYVFFPCRHREHFASLASLATKRPVPFKCTNQALMVVSAMGKNNSSLKQKLSISNRRREK